MYRKALGLDGAEGSTEARSAFSTSPGYDFNMDQGMQALTRARAVNGTLASGNMDTDAMKFASGLAAQDWNNWLSNLSNLDTKRYGATTAQAGTFGDIARGALTIGAAKAGVAQQTAQGIGEAGKQGLMAGQQAAANRFGALLGGANLISSLAGKTLGAAGGGGAFSIFGGGSGGLGTGKDSDWV